MCSWDVLTFAIARCLIGIRDGLVDGLNPDDVTEARIQMRERSHDSGPRQGTRIVVGRLGVHLVQSKSIANNVKTVRRIVRRSCI